MTEHLYVMGCPRLHIVKIGITADIDKRWRVVQAHCPLPVSVLWFTPGSPHLERAVHQRFQEQRSHGEWFKFGRDPLQRIQDVAREEQERLGSAGLVPLPAPRTPTQPEVYRDDDYVTFAVMALVLRERGIDMSATADSLRYIARSREDWPVGLPGQGKP